MAQTITAPLLGTFLSGPGQTTTLADQTTTTADFAPNTNFSNVVARVAQKTYTVGTGTARPIYEIQVADDSAYTTNVRKIALAQMARTANTHAVLEGMCLDGSKAHVRIVVTLDGTDTVTFDADIACS